MYKKIMIDFRFGGEKMFIGKMVLERMNALGMNAKEVSDNTLIDECVINEILEDKLSISEMDILDVEFLAESLYCTPEYFLDENIRKKDVLNSSLNRGRNSIKSNIIKAKIQVVMEDFGFMNDIYSSIRK
ncbi:hypothetical protein [Clostridium perfringens]|uniref:hypothetical protein n=1 Tax=Clostridium perfringens TaxID=1502 RepID=UPI002FCCD883